MGWLADRWPKKRVMLLIYVIVAVSIPLLVDRALARRCCGRRRSSSASASAATT